MHDSGAHIKRAELLLQQSRPRDAEKELKRALQLEPYNHYVISLMAKCKLDLKEFSKAAELIESAISQSPNDDYYFYLYAFINYQQDRNGNALLHIQKACAINPYGDAYYGLWAMILIEEKQFKSALAKADEGLALNPAELTCLNARATALNKLSRQDDAVITMQNALQQDPENEFTHVTVGFNLLEKGKHREAAKHFREALRINPEMDSARTGLKEALKSRVAPYRWLLQYNYWITNKSKNARWIIPVAIFIGVRLFAGASAVGGTHWKILGGIVIGLYLLLVATSWIINPLSNFFLLFDKDGKYAITSTERWNALTFTVAIAVGLIIVIAAFMMPGATTYHDGMLTGGLILMSLAIPLGHMRFPWQIRGANFLQWYSMTLVTGGFVAAIICIGTAGTFPVIATLYVAGFAAYMWVHAFSRR